MVREMSHARLDVEMTDRFGRPVKPREWFLVPLHVIDDVVERIRDRSITQFAYDPLVVHTKSSISRPNKLIAWARPALPPDRVVRDRRPLRTAGLAEPRLGISALSGDHPVARSLQ